MSREVLKSVGWALFLGVGIALGLRLGSLGAAVPADTGLLVWAGLIVASATVVVRLALAFWRQRTTGSPHKSHPVRRAPVQRSAPAAAAPTIVPVEAPASEGPAVSGSKAARAPGRKSPTGKTAGMSRSRAAGTRTAAGGASSAKPVAKRAGTTRQPARKATPKRPSGA